MYFDTHTHVQFAAFKDDWKEVIDRALAQGVWLINVGTQRDTSKRAIEIAQYYEEGLPAEASAKAGVYATVGLHPLHTAKSFHDAKELGDAPDAKGFTSRGEEFNYEYYKKLATHPKVVAIGECGLDYYHGARNMEHETREKQRRAFLKQVELAREVKKPLMIHCREAFPDLISMLHASRSMLNDLPGIVHFFTGTMDDAKKLLNLGFSFTFGGVITFPPAAGKRAGDYDEIIKMLPMERILSETDAPYVTPVPYRGTRNEPAYVIEIVKRLAELKGIQLEEMRDRIWENAKKVLGLS